MNKKICNAIHNKKIISFVYDGGKRIVEPFCHGISSAGNEVLRGFQVGGYSKTGNPIGWKLFKVSDMSGILITQNVFTGNRPGYNAKDSAMTSICCHI